MAQFSAYAKTPAVQTETRRALRIHVSNSAAAAVVGGARSIRTVLIPASICSEASASLTSERCHDAHAHGCCDCGAARQFHRVSHIHGWRGHAHKATISLALLILLFSIPSFPRGQPLLELAFPSSSSSSVAVHTGIVKGVLAQNFDEEEAAGNDDNYYYYSSAEGGGDGGEDGGSHSGGGEGGNPTDAGPIQCTPLIETPTADTAAFQPAVVLSGVVSAAAANAGLRYQSVCFGDPSIMGAPNTLSPHPLPATGRPAGSHFCDVSFSFSTLSATVTGVFEWTSSPLCFRLSTPPLSSVKIPVGAAAVASVLVSDAEALGYCPQEFLSPNSLVAARIYINGASPAPSSTASSLPPGAVTLAPPAATLDPLLAPMFDARSGLPVAPNAMQNVGNRSYDYSDAFAAFAFFELQALGIAARARCAPRRLQSTFGNIRMIAPFSFWGGGFFGAGAATVSDVTDSSSGSGSSDQQHLNKQRVEVPRGPREGTTDSQYEGAVIGTVAVLVAVGLALLAAALILVAYGAARRRRSNACGRGGVGSGAELGWGGASLVSPSEAFPPLTPAALLAVLDSASNGNGQSSSPPHTVSPSRRTRRRCRPNFAALFFRALARLHSGLWWRLVAAVLPGVLFACCQLLVVDETIGLGFDASVGYAYNGGSSGDLSLVATIISFVRRLRSRAFPVAVGAVGLALFLALTVIVMPLLAVVLAYPHRRSEIPSSEEEEREKDVAEEEGDGKVSTPLPRSNRRGGRHSRSCRGGGGVRGLFLALRRALLGSHEAAVVSVPLFYATRGDVRLGWAKRRRALVFGASDDDDDDDCHNEGDGGKVATASEEEDAFAEAYSQWLLQSLLPPSSAAKGAAAEAEAAVGGTVPLLPPPVQPVLSSGGHGSGDEAAMDLYADNKAIPSSIEYGSNGDVVARGYGPLFAEGNDDEAPPTAVAAGGSHSHTANAVTAANAAAAPRACSPVSNTYANAHADAIVLGARSNAAPLDGGGGTDWLRREEAMGAFMAIALSELDCSAPPPPPFSFSSPRIAPPTDTPPGGNYGPTLVPIPSFCCVASGWGCSCSNSNNNQKKTNRVSDSYANAEHDVGEGEEGEGARKRRASDPSAALTAPAASSSEQHDEEASRWCRIPTPLLVLFAPSAATVPHDARRVFGSIISWRLPVEGGGRQKGVGALLAAEEEDAEEEEGVRSVRVSPPPPIPSAIRSKRLAAPSRERGGVISTRAAASAPSAETVGVDGDSSHVHIHDKEEDDGGWSTPSSSAMQMRKRTQRQRRVALLALFLLFGGALYPSVAGLLLGLPSGLISGTSVTGACVPLYAVLAVLFVLLALATAAARPHRSVAANGASVGMFLLTAAEMWLSAMLASLGDEEDGEGDGEDADGSDVIVSNPTNATLAPPVPMTTTMMGLNDVPHFEVIGGASGSGGGSAEAAAAISTNGDAASRESARDALVAALVALWAVHALLTLLCRVIGPIAAAFLEESVFLRDVGYLSPSRPPTCAKTTRINSLPSGVADFSPDGHCCNASSELRRSAHGNGHAKDTQKCTCSPQPPFPPPRLLLAATDLFSGTAVRAQCRRKSCNVSADDSCACACSWVGSSSSAALDCSALLCETERRVRAARCGRLREKLRQRLAVALRRMVAAVPSALRRTAVGAGYTSGKPTPPFATPIRAAPAARAPTGTPSPADEAMLKITGKRVSEVALDGHRTQPRGEIGARWYSAAAFAEEASVAAGDGPATTDDSDRLLHIRGTRVEVSLSEHFARADAAVAAADDGARAADINARRAAEGETRLAFFSDDCSDNRPPFSLAVEDTRAAALIMSDTASPMASSPRTARPRSNLLPPNDATAVAGAVIVASGSPLLPPPAEIEKAVVSAAAAAVETRAVAFDRHGWEGRGAGRRHSSRLAEEAVLRHTAAAPSALGSHFGSGGSGLAAAPLPLAEGRRGNGQPAARRNTFDGSFRHLADLPPLVSPTRQRAAAESLRADEMTLPTTPEHRPNRRQAALNRLQRSANGAEGS